MGLAASAYWEPAGTSSKERSSNIVGVRGAWRPTPCHTTGARVTRGEIHRTMKQAQRTMRQDKHTCTHAAGAVLCGALQMILDIQTLDISLTRGASLAMTVLTNPCKT